MITKWDIISNIRPTDNALAYALLIDGTEQDAHIIAKKLDGYVKQAQPALPPYVYRFPLPDDLDEDTLEKIRVAVREGVKQAKKMNDFIPDSSFSGINAEKEDKEFPSFVSLDPSDSFFRAAHPAPPPPPAPHKRIHKKTPAREPEEEIPQIAKTLEEIDNEGYRSDPLTEPAPSENSGEPYRTHEAAMPAPDAATDGERPAPEDILTSVESAEEWPDTPPQTAQANSSDAVASAEGMEDIHLQVQAVTAQELPEELRNAAKDVSIPHAAVPPQTQAESDLPISDRDMLIKDMEGTMLGQSLDDIFLAETKYDMFVDLDQLTPKKDQNAPSAQADAAKQQAPQQQAAPLSRPQPDASATEEAAFNIFDQKIKDQTNFIDLDDIKGITERITQKDLEFVKHAQVSDYAEAPKPEPSAETYLPDPENIALDKTRAYMPLPSSFGRVEEDTQEVMDPFEQMMAAAQQPKQETKPAEAASPISPEGKNELIPPSAQTEQAGEVSAVAEPVQEKQELTLPPQPEQEPVPHHEDEISQETEPVAPQPPETAEPEAVLAPRADDTAAPPTPIISEPQTAETLPAEETSKVPPAHSDQNRQTGTIVPPARPIMEKAMPENQGDKKPILRIKRKPQPEQNAAQQPPKPVPPAPKRPQTPPMSGQPHPAAPQQPAPQEEKHNTILRRRRPESTFLEKTRTIDHSIELPLSELKKHNWPLEVPLIPTYTLENMTISVNRFAHATAISVIDNPGKLYNPLVLHGSSGTGKTHFLHAIGYALSNKYGQENIFITNGVRLSRGIQRYVMEGNMDKFENFTNSVKALLIDDLHLIAINEQNRTHLSKLLNDFLKQQKQIVITSKYPPESLAKLEELLNFRLDSGWISDLKPATGSARMRIIQKMLHDNNIDITDDDVNRFFGHANMSMGTVSRAIRRVRVLEKLIFPNESVEKRSASAIFDQLLATEGEDQKSLIAQKYPEDVTSAPVEGRGEWGRIGFFYPQNHSNMMNWLVFALQQRAKELGIKGGPELAVRSSYSTENIISSAFKIANLCDNKKLKGAVILGPEVTACDPSVRENFYDILTHMLEIMLIRCGVVNYENVSAPSTYVKILSELLR